MFHFSKTVFQIALESACNTFHSEWPCLRIPVASYHHRHCVVSLFKILTRGWQTFPATGQIGNILDFRDQPFNSAIVVKKQSSTISEQMGMFAFAYNWSETSFPSHLHTSQWVGERKSGRHPSFLQEHGPQLHLSTHSTSNWSECCHRVKLQERMGNYLAWSSIIS